MVRPAAFPEGCLRYRNQSAAKMIGLDHLTDSEWKAHFWKFEPLPQNLPEPLALRYHGHQFQSYNPELGDGRGFLFAQMQAQGKLLDLGTKGSGQTPYSRSGDGRLTLKGAVREALATEMLPLVGVNTSKTFSIFETGENLKRNDEPSPTRSAVLLRLSHSHIRFGTFQRLAYFEKAGDTEKLIDYCLKNYFPHLLGNANKAEAFFEEVLKRTAKLAAEWMIGGFVHGVLNTDNMNITGESFDYGPYRFLPSYDPGFTAAYFDHTGLYSYGRQPSACLWNLAQLGKAIESQVSFEKLEPHLENFSAEFSDNCGKQLLKRLNLIEKTEDDTQSLIKLFFEFQDEAKPPFEQTFFDLTNGANESRLLKSPLKESYSAESAKALIAQIRTLDVKNETRLSHPYFEKSAPSTLLYPEIESIWARIDQDDDWSTFDRKITELQDLKKILG